MKYILVGLIATLLVSGVVADVYLHNPRGSNNRLNEAANNVANQNRLFDSQNNDEGGYHWGPSMYYYADSILSVHFTNQHGAGAGFNHANQIIQVMCEDTLRDGDHTQGANGRNTYDPANGDQAGGNAIRGRHETGDWYNDCAARERNKGLFIADQNLNDNIGATSTRQNAGGTRYGTECPEERDYYPYWHPTPWADLAIYSSNHTEACAYYQAESQNIMDKGICSDPQFNNAAACSQGGGTWTVGGAWGTAPPVCAMQRWSIPNYNGNGNAITDAATMQHGNVTFAPHIPAAWIDKPCALRLRYNISTDDYDAWAIDYNSNGIENSPVVNDPAIDIGFNTKLQLALNTAQTGRTFEERSHMFTIKATPTDLPAGTVIHNLNVMGHRGNINQVFPAIEYDFVPSRLHVAEADRVHIQWTGSDYNEANRAGEGADQQDRSNIVQLKNNCQSCNYPEDLADVDLIDPADPDHDAKVTSLALLGQTNNVLNDAPAYWDHGLEQFPNAGSYHYMCTRNNNFTNRSQKGSIVVGADNFLAGGAAVAVAVGGALIAVAAAAGAMAFYARAHPTSQVGQIFAARSLTGSGGSVGSRSGNYSQASGFTRSRGGGSRGSRGSQSSRGHGARSSGSRKTSRSSKSKGSRGSKGSKFTQQTAFTRAQR